MASLPGSKSSDLVRYETPTEGFFKITRKDWEVVTTAGKWYNCGVIGAWIELAQVYLLDCITTSLLGAPKLPLRGVRHPFLHPPVTEPRCAGPGSKPPWELAGAQ